MIVCLRLAPTPSVQKSVRGSQGAHIWPQPTGPVSTAALCARSPAFLLWPRREVFSRDVVPREANLVQKQGV